MAEILLKIIVLGESGVGKSSIINQYCHQRFSHDHKATIGADFFTKKLDIGQNLITLQIWDTAGQERFQSLGKAFYRGANACILVYDITNKQSFDRVDDWKLEFDRINNVRDNDRFPFLLLGNKCDLHEDRAITRNQAEQYAASNDMECYETSALDGTNIKEAIFKIAQIASEVPHIPVLTADAVRNLSEEDLFGHPNTKSGCGCMDYAVSSVGGGGGGYPSVPPSYQDAYSNQSHGYAHSRQSQLSHHSRPYGT